MDFLEVAMKSLKHGNQESKGSVVVSILTLTFACFAPAALIAQFPEDGWKEERFSLNGLSPERVEWALPGEVESPFESGQGYPRYPFLLGYHQFFEQVLYFLVDEHEDLVGEEPLAAGDSILVRTTPGRLRRIRRFFEKLREASRANVQLDLDLVRCDPQAALELILNSSRGPVAMKDDERASFFSRLEKGSHIISESLRCRDGGKVEFSGVRRGLDVPFPEPRSHILKLWPLGTPGGVILTLEGSLDIPLESGKIKGLPHSALFQSTTLFLPSNRTVLAGVAAAPALLLQEKPSILLLFIRASRDFSPSRLDFGWNFHAFDVRDVVGARWNYEGPKLIRKETKGEELASAGTGGGSMTFSGSSESEFQPLDPDELIELIREKTGGDEAWGEDNTIEFHWSILLVRAFHPAIIPGIEKLLAELRSSRRHQAQISAFWLALDRATFESLRKEKLEGRRLLESLKQTGSLRILDAAGCAGSNLRAASLQRIDGWAEWPGKEGSSPGRLFDVREYRDGTGATLKYTIRGDPGTRWIHLDLLAQSGVLAPPGTGPVLASRLETTVSVENGSLSLLGGSPRLADVESGMVLLLRSTWAEYPEVRSISPEMEEAFPEELSEVLLPLKREEEKVRKIFSEKHVSWPGERKASLASVAAWLRSETGVSVLVDPEIEVQALSVEIPRLGKVTASRFLHWTCRGANLEWIVFRGQVLVGRWGDMDFYFVKDLDIPSVKDFTSPEDREAFLALSREVELDLSGIRSFGDLFEEIAGKTNVPHAPIDPGLDRDLDIQFPTFPPPGPRVIPVVLLMDLRGQIRWFLRDGVVVYPDFLE